MSLRKGLGKDLGKGSDAIQHVSRIAETSARNLLALEHLGGDCSQLVDLLQQHLELGFAQMFAQTPIALLRTGDDRIMRSKARCGQRDQNLAAVFWVR